MKKSEFKSLIKESVKEVLVEEGILSTIVAEVLRGVNVSTTVIKEDNSEQVHMEQLVVREERASNQKQKLHETKKKMLDAIGKGSYGGVNIFEGTEPLRSAGNSSGAPSAPSNPLSHVDPGDAGVDISALAGSTATIWKKMKK